MTVSINPLVKFFLQQHLVNQREPYADALCIGTLEELTAVVKIKSSKAVSRCLSCPAYMRRFPDLPALSSIVALVDRGCHVHVMAVYTIKQMHQIQSSSGTKNIEWKVLEMSKDLEEELLKEIDVASGAIFSPLETMLKKL